jgi:hypothetical protein
MVFRRRSHHHVPSRLIASHPEVISAPTPQPLSEKAVGISSPLGQPERQLAWPLVALDEVGNARWQLAAFEIAAPANLLGDVLGYVPGPALSEVETNDPDGIGVLAAVCLSPPTKNAAGQKMTIAAAVATPSLVRWLSCVPDKAAALVDID